MTEYPPHVPLRPARRPSLDVLLLLAAASAATVPLGAAAAPAFYRCEDHGSVVYQDSPCDVKPPLPGPARPPGPSFDPITPGGSGGPAREKLEVPQGDWRGQAQYQGTESGEEVHGSQSVVPLVLSLAEDGRVTGASQENGCRLLGIWSPGGAPRLASLDVTLTGCSFEGFNRRYSGSLLTASNERAAQLSLQSYDAVPGKPARLYDLKGVLRR